MITDVRVFTPRVTTALYPYRDTGSERSDPFQIQSIDGLGPAEASINTTDYATVDGSYYNGSDIGQRNIVLNIGLNPKWGAQSYFSLRQQLYSYFMPKNQIKLRFFSDSMPTVEIVGYVESFTPNLFDKEAAYQVSVICPDPAFVATSPTVVKGKTLALPDGTPTFITYNGNLDVGFVLDIKANSSYSSNGEVRVVNERPDLEVYDVASANITTSQYLELVTQTGSKSLSLITSSGTTNILGQQAAGSIWLQLAQGINKFRVMSKTAGLDWTMTYYAKYGGL